MLKKKIWANFQRIIELFTQKVVTKLLKIWVWDPGSGIRDPGSRKNLFRIPDPGVKKALDPGSGSATLNARSTNTRIGILSLIVFLLIVIYKTGPSFLNGSQLCLDHGGAEEYGAPEVMAPRIFCRVGHLRQRPPHLQVGGLGRAQAYLGLAAEFRPEKIPRNRLGKVSSLFRVRKCSFRGIPKFTEESIPKLRTEGNGMKKISITKNPAPANRIRDTLRNGIPSCCLPRNNFFVRNCQP